MTVSIEQLKTFAAQVQALREAHFIKQDYKHSCGTMTVQPGKKYARIVTNDPHPSAYCFVNLETGDILKSAGWSAPAKGVRGNIANGVADVNIYGAAYLR
jgi:hypothetical protein